MDVVDKFLKRENIRSGSMFDIFRGESLQGGVYKVQVGKKQKYFLDGELDYVVKDKNNGKFYYDLKHWKEQCEELASKIQEVEYERAAIGRVLLGLGELSKGGLYEKLLRLGSKRRRVWREIVMRRYRLMKQLRYWQMYEGNFLARRYSVCSGWWETLRHL